MYWVLFTCAEFTGFKLTPISRFITFVWINGLIGWKRLEKEGPCVWSLYETGVFARVSPENKLQIVEALRERKEIVTMTGDGVNDAPALNRTDIGIAMGVRRTEVAKESSDMILTNDRLSTIVDAVRVGRVIFDNIKKFVSFLFTCNLVEITTIFLTVVYLLPMPVALLHIS